MVSQHAKSYWGKVLYKELENKPTAAAPVKTLNKPYSQYFAQIRKLLLSLKDVVESQEFFTATWKWTWSYEYNSNKLLYLHPCEDAVIATFIISHREELKLLNASEIDPNIKLAIRQGRNARNVRWVSYELRSTTQMENLFEAINLKYDLLTAKNKIRQVEIVAS